MARRLLPYVLFAVLVFLLLWPVLLQDNVLLAGAMLGKLRPWSAQASEETQVHWNALAWDGVGYYYPDRVFLSRCLRGMHLPLWNPYKMCGVPFAADPQTSAFYPPNLLYALLSPDRAWNWLAALHLFAAGAFTFIMLRGLRLGVMPSTFGGVGFMLCGFSIVWLELPVFLSVAVWLPLALHYARLAHERGSAGYAVAGGLMVALSLLGGHPQIAFYSLLAIGLFWLYLTAWRRAYRNVWRSLWLGALMFVLGLALAAPQLLPSFELAALSHRGGTTPTPEGYAAYSAWAIPLWRLVVLLVPDFFGNPSRDGMWVAGEYAEYCGYVGIFVLLMLPIAFVRRRRISYVWFFGGLATLGLLMALGTGVNRLFYFYVPGFAHSGSPARALYLFMFSAAVLGAFGLERLLARQYDSCKIIWPVLSSLGIIAVATAFVLLAVSQFSESLSPIELLMALSPSIGLCIALILISATISILIASGRIGRTIGGILAIGVLAADLMTFGTGYNLTSPRSAIYPPTRLTRLLQSTPEYHRVMPVNEHWALGRIPDAVLPPNTSQVYGFFDTQGYGSMYPVRYKALLDAFAGRDSSPPETGNMVFVRKPDGLADLLGVEYIVSSVPMGKWSEADDCYVLRRDSRSFPRAFLVSRLEPADDDQTLDRMVHGSADLLNTALVSKTDADRLIPFLASGNSARTTDKEQAVIRAYEPGQVTVSISTSRPSILILTDQYYPGWKAYVDGKEASVVRVDYVFRGVAVPSGSHRVTFSYEPRSFQTGLRCFCLAALFILCWGVRVLARSLRRR